MNKMDFNRRRSGKSTRRIAFFLMVFFVVVLLSGVLSNDPNAGFIGQGFTFFWMAK